MFKFKKAWKYILLYVFFFFLNLLVSLEYYVKKVLKSYTLNFREAESFLSRDQYRFLFIRFRGNTILPWINVALGNG